MPHVPKPLVLVVDDDDAVRVTLTELLATSGYNVAEANCASAALDFLASGASVNLMLTDIAMPGMRGTELADVAMQRWPGLRVMLMSGFAPPGAMKHPFIQKPFAAARLLEAIAELQLRKSNGSSPG